jgi:hypothetical protein
MKVTTICAVCETPVEIPATEVKSRNFCSNDCWRWYPVQESLARTDPFRTQLGSSRRGNERSKKK